MAARIKLTIDWFNKRLIKSPSNGAQFFLPKFHQGDVIPFQIYVVEPDPDRDLNSFVNVDIANATLKLGVSDTPTGTPGGPSPFVTQFTWSKNLAERYFNAEVSFNTAALNTFLGSEREKDAWLEIEMTDGTSIVTVWQGKITLVAEIIETGSLTVAPGETPLSLEIANALFLKKQTDPGDRVVFVSADGNSATTIYTHDDGSWREEPSQP